MTERRIADDRQTIPFLFGRNALHKAAESLVKRGIMDLSVPAYACGDELEALRQAGIEMHPYDVIFNPKDGLFHSQRQDDSISEALIVNYFGLPNAHEFAEVITDNAYNLIDLSTERARPMGAFAIYSLRKQLLTPNGAFLVSKDPVDMPPIAQLPSEVAEYESENYRRYHTGAVSQGSGIHLGIDSRNPFGPRYAQYGGYTLTDDDLQAPNKTELEERSKQVRREFSKVFAIISRAVDDNQLAIASSMITHEVAFPTMLPVIVSDSQAMYDRFAANNFKKCTPFWNKTYSAIDSTQFPFAAKLKHTLFAFSFIHPWTDNDFDTLIDLTEKGILQ